MPCQACWLAPPCAPCGREATCPTFDAMLNELHTFEEQLRVDLRRWEVTHKEPPRQTGSAATPPESLDIRLWPAMSFAGLPRLVLGPFLLIAGVLFATACFAWRLAFRRIELLKILWNEVHGVDEWSTKLGSAIAGVTRIATWMPLLVVATLLLVAAVAYRGSTGSSGSPDVHPATTSTRCFPRSAAMHSRRTPAPLRPPTRPCSGACRQMRGNAKRSQTEARGSSLARPPAIVSRRPTSGSTS